LNFKALLKNKKMNLQIRKLKNQIRYLLVFFIVALVISGATAMPGETELSFFLKYFPSLHPVSDLFFKVFDAIHRTNQNYPYLMYGYDWLAFGHFVIAAAFIGPLKDPVKNIWVIDFGMIACVMVLPFALIVGGFRELPFWWRLIDCSFGVVGIIPLWITRNKILALQRLYEAEKLNIFF
jgi:hypothetical protein